MNRAKAYDGKGDHARAIADFNEAIRLDSRRAETYNDRGLALANAGRIEPARADFEQALRLNPSLAAAHDNLALAHAALGDTAAAEAEFAAAIRLSPRDMGPRRDRCLVRAVVGDLARAMEDCSAAVRMAPDSSITHRIMGFLLLRLDHAEQARSEYDAALVLRPRSAEALYGRGMAERALGRTAEADRDIAAARRLDPDVSDEAGILRQWRIAAPA